MNKRHLVKPKTLSRLIKCGYKPEDNETTYLDIIDWLDSEKDLQVTSYVEYDEDEDNDFDINGLSKEELDEYLENHTPKCKTIYRAFAENWSDDFSNRYDAYDNLFNVLIDKKILTPDRK